jgi:hypothetical protein
LRDETIWQQNNKQQNSNVLPLGKNGLYLQQNTTQGGTTVFLQGRDSYRWWQILVVVTSRSNKDGQ